MSDINPAPAGVDGGISTEERQWAMFAHLSALAGGILTSGWAGSIGCFIGPLVIWLMKKDTMPFVGDQAKEALNFNITVAIGYCLSGLLAIVFIGIPLMVALWIAWLVLVIIAGVRASEGISYRYPATIRFVK